MAINCTRISARVSRGCDECSAFGVQGVQKIEGGEEVVGIISELEPNHKNKHSTKNNKWRKSTAKNYIQF